MERERKKKIALSIGVIAIITAIITAITMLVSTNNQKAKLAADPEIQRSMEYEQVQEGDEKVPNTDYVQFDAFFLRDLNGDGYAEQVRGTCRDINKTDTLYMNLNVLTNGKLVDGKITIKTSNMRLSTAIVEDNVIKENYISNNTTEIKLKDVNNGTQKLLYGTVNASDFGNDTNKYSQVNSVQLTGTHIANDGTQTQINKTVNFNVDWYGTVNASIYDYTGTQNIEQITDANKENITLNFSVTTRETNDDLILKKAVLEGTIPTVNGYKPTSVELTSSDVNFEYDEETGNFTVAREASINETGIVTKTVSSYNTFSFKVTYPYELYEQLSGDTLSLQVPIKSYYEGFNNPNEEFENPIKSNEVQRNITFLWRKPEGSVARFDVTIGKYRSYDYNYVISKEEPLKIYNETEEETKDLYEVRWYAYTGDQINASSIQMKETSTPYTDRFSNTDGEYYNMADYTKNVGIYFSNVENALGEDGYIKVINDETGEEIHTFTKEDWNNYSISSPYMYAEPVKHIRIETSKANKNASFYAYNIKEIDDKVLTTTFTKDKFDKLEKVYTYLTGNIKTEGSEEYTKINDDQAYALYEEPISVASITVNRDTIGTQNIEKDINLVISTRNDYYNMKGWTNGRFLVELPEEILDVEINNVTISNSSVKLLAYEIVEKDGKKFIKIETENENEANYNITINTNLTADPRSVTQTKSVKLYAYNEFCNNYKNKTADIYDVDGDENVTENVNYATDSLNMVAPSSLLTNQQATNYNEAGETAIAPQIATIDKTEADTATVNVSVTNNYAGTISEVSILGKIPFQGNTFSINGTDLGSNYTTQMLDGGITVPADMKDKVTVYYSEKENPTTDINDSENGWTTTPDFSKVKTYLINLGNYVLGVKENRVFTYQIKVPTTVKYNDVSYSTHAVYFCLDTAEGKFKTQTETTKLGFRIERKYNLNMLKLKEDTDIPVQGATFSITAEGESETRTGTTNSSGTFSIQNLLVDKTYVLKEIRTPGSYEKNETEVKFKVVVQDNELVLQILDGEDNLKEYNITQATADSRGILNLKVENTPKYKLIITKKDDTDGTPLAGVKYKLEGEGLGNGITVSTNKEGVLTLTGLSHEVEYTLTEIEAKDYYVNEEPIKFKVVKNGSKLKLAVTTPETFATYSPELQTGTAVTGLDAQDTATAELVDEKIPTYQVSVKKYAKDEDTILKGAQYKITGEGISEKGVTYTTDDTGVLTIPNLYEYVEGKNITGVYTLQEITPPEGYALDSRQLQFKAQRNEEGQLELQILNDNFLRNSSVQDNTINLEFEDEPLFKITKIDAKTKLPIQNAKFVIKEIDENYQELGYAQDINGNVVGTLEENVGAGSIVFPLNETTYPWKKLDDGTFQSDVNRKTNATSTMTSQEFTLEKDGSISFEWAVSSESASYDYVYYTITNTKNNQTIGGTSTKIGGNSSITNYEDLKFSTVTEELSAGTYKIAFTYRTDGSNNYGLDSGFVKNITVDGMNTKIPVVRTDENGEISYGLKAGLYKATEIEAPEGYDLPTEEKDRTYFFGIGESKEQESTFGTSFNNAVVGPFWNKVNSVEATTDNGFVTGGYFTKEADLNKDGVADITGNDSYYSGFVAKYNDEGNMEFAKSIHTENGEIRINKTIQTNDGGYVAVGKYTGKDLQVNEVSTGLTNDTNYSNGLVIKLGSSGELVWAKEVKLEGTNYDATAVTQNVEGNIFVGVTTESNPKVIEYSNSDGSIAGEATISDNVEITDMDGYNSQDVIIVSQNLTSTTKGRVDFYSNGSVNAGSSLDFNANAVTRLENGKAIIVGNYTGTAQSVSSKGNYDGIIIVYDINSNTIESSKFIRGTLDEVLTSVAKTTDGGYMVGGYTYSSQVDFNQEETTWEIPSISGNSDGFIIKYDADGNQAWYKQVSGDNLDEVIDVTERDENEFVAVGYFNSTSVKGDKADATGLNLTQYTDGFIFNYGEVITAPEVPESSEITIENKLKQFQITTDVEEVDGVKGGSISGEDQAPYETVEYGKDSTKEIKIVPDQDYKIVKITINGENYEFTPAEDGTVTMPQFTDMNVNKHIVVTFSNTASSVLVHHYIDGTETRVAEDDHIAGTIGERYTTAPHVDLDEYELKQENGEYVIPDNASGTFVQEEEVVIYYYVKKQVPLTVHHYIEGTNEQVPLKTGETAQDVVTKGEIGTAYTTTALTADELDPKYELSVVPDNSTGTYTKDGVTVTYYYKAKNVEITTTVQTHKETNEMGEEVDVAGGTISGQNQKPYETVVYGEDSKNDIVAIPDENYQVKQILINGEPLEFTPEEDGTVILNKFTDMTEDKHVVVEFEKIPAKVIVHYYIEGTTNKVPLQTGGTAEDVTQTGVVGDIYATKPADNVNSMYDLISTPTNASGTMTKDTIEVIYYYKLKATSVLVHHYKENTTEKLSDDVIINGKVGDSYTTQVATDIPQNYELVATPTNATGSMTENQIVVTYYYRLKTPSVTNNITKTGTDRITVANQEMSYTVTYTATVTDYIGNAEVTIVDTLPYEIDEQKSDLAGGTYDAASKTITWKENISNINSYTGNGTVNVTKNLKVVYVGLDMNQEKVVNNVKGNIKLLTPEKTSEEVTGSQEGIIYKAIISSEKLVDKTEAVEGEKVTYTVRITNEGNLAKTVTVRDTLPAGITFDKDTLIQVGETGTVYTEQNLKNGIPVEVPANESVDVVFAGKVDTLANNEYSKTLTNQATVDNEPTNEVTTNVTKANITAHKEADPASGNKVRLGDEITYRIRVRNDGTREGTAVVKDTIPTGTTFVEGSVKIDNVADSTKTATDLANGISITVEVGKEVVVEFKVTVNKLIDGTKIKNTAYINQNGEDKKVPEEPEHTYVEPKEEQSITKNGTATIDSLNSEITYNINYTARITDYSGRATVKLVDKLPYAIDEAKSDLAGGTYDAQAQTITWEETVEGIQLTEEKEVTINKTIKIVYTGISQETTAIKNIVTGHIEYETPQMTSDEVTANHTTTTGFIINIPVSKVWEDDTNKLGQRPSKVIFKLHGSDGSEYTKDLAKPETAGSTTTQDSSNPNKWNDIFENLPKYDSNKQEIVYTLTEEEKTEGDLKYYDSVVTDKLVTNTNKYGKVTVHHYIMNTDGSKTTTRVPDINGTEIADVVIEGKAGDKYTTEEAKNINEKYELVAEELPANATGTIEKYNEEKPQEVIYYYRLKPAKVLINYLEKDNDTDDSNNVVLSSQEQITGYVDHSYNTDTDHRKETIEKDGKTYTLVSDSGNKTGNMKVQDINVTYYYLQNTKATVRYVERDSETHEIVKDLEEPYTQEGLVGDEFATNEKAFVGYKLVESPANKTINMTKEEQTLIYYYEPVYTGLIENHIDDKTGKILETETHDIQVGEDYDIPSKEFEGYDLVESKLPENAKGTMGEELVTVNYYYIKKAVLEVNYIDKLTREPLTEQIVDETKHEGDEYTTEQKTFDNYDLVEVPSNANGTMVVETDEEGNITNNRTVVTYYYSKKSAGVEEHHIDSLTGKDIEEPTIHNGHVGDEYDIKAKEFLSYKLVEADEEGNSMLPTNATGTMTEEKIVVNYYYNQPAKVIVHYVEKATGKELEETNPETGELQNSQVIIEGQKDDEYTTTAKEFEYYTLIETPTEPNGTMKVEITKDEEGNDVVNNTIELYYYYEAKPFNIGVEKEITGIIVNGERRDPTSGKLEKVEIYRKATEDTSVQVEYKIKVMNTGEVSGNATIEENIPEGMSLANNDGTWEEQEGKLIKVIPELGAGETKQYTVLLNWEQTGENMGEKANEVKLVETGNVPGFVDNNDKDNTSNANVIISVETGELPIGLILALVALVGLETVTLRYAVVLTKRQKKKVNKK